MRGELEQGMGLEGSGGRGAGQGGQGELSLELPGRGNVAAALGAGRLATLGPRLLAVVGLHDAPPPLLALGRRRRLRNAHMASWGRAENPNASKRESKAHRKTKPTNQDEKLVARRSAADGSLLGRRAQQSTDRKRIGNKPNRESIDRQRWQTTNRELIARKG